MPQVDLTGHCQSNSSSLHRDPNLKSAGPVPWIEIIIVPFEQVGHVAGRKPHGEKVPREDCVNRAAAGGDVSFVRERGPALRGKSYARKMIVEIGEIRDFNPGKIEI